MEKADLHYCILLIWFQFSAHFPPLHRWYKYIEGTQQKKAVVLDDRVKQVSGTLIIKDAVVDDSGS